MALESKHEEELRKAVVRAGGLCIKLPAFLYRGIPDRLILLPGARIFFVELKKAGASTKASTRLHQEAFRKTLLKLGFNHDRIEGPEETRKWIETHVN